MKYEVWIHANWGISKADRVICEDEEEMMRVYARTKLGGLGNIVSVEALVDGKRVKSKRLKSDV